MTFKSDEYSCCYGAGGGRLEIEVRNIFRVDGTIKANSLDKSIASSLNGASGGSGGSIWVRAGAFVGKLNFNGI